MLRQIFLCLVSLSFSVLMCAPLWSAQRIVLIEGDIVVANGPTARSVGLSADAKVWPNGVIPYIFDESLSASRQTAVIQAIEHWNEVGGISFLPLTQVQQDSLVPVQDSIRFVPGDHCASWVGRKGGQQNVWVSATCTAGSVMHELGHVLGLEHEHTRSDRDQYIEVLWENVKSDKYHNFDFAPAGSRLLGSYDYDSIMHYGTHNFTANGEPTIATIDGVSRRLGQRLAPSDGDIDAVAQLYGGDLSLVSRMFGDTDSWSLEIYVSNQVEQGAHDLVLELDAPVNLTGRTLDNNGGWQCELMENATATRCSLNQLAGNAVSRLLLGLDDFSESETIRVSLTANTPDHDKSNNLSIAIANVAGANSIPDDEPFLAAVIQNKNPIDDDASTEPTARSGGSSSFWLLAFLILLLIGQTGFRINNSVVQLFFGIHRR